METKDNKAETKAENKQGTTGTATTEKLKEEVKPPITTPIVETTKEEVKTETKAENKQETPIVKLDPADSLHFPLELMNTVYLRRIPMHSRLPGQNMDEAKLKVGSAYKGNAVLRGLTFNEEVRYLSNVIGLSTASPNWEKETKDYWANISKDVPKDGVELEVGMRYMTKEDYIYDRDQAKKDINGTIIEGKGTPINLSDYILWRYCLLYSRVANNFELIGMSPKIEFYLFSKEKEIADKKSILNSKRNASLLMFKRLSDREWVDYVLRVLVSKDKNFAKKYQVSDIAKITPDEKDILLDEYVTSDPDGFLAVAEDKNLEMRSFLEVCIAANKLTRIPNTDTIVMDGTPLGSSIMEAISFLNNPKNNDTLQTLKAQIKHTPT